MDEGYKSLPLNPLRAFAIASRHRTFTAAANYMGISQVAISRQIAILEDYLGVSLFERGARSVKLTDVGRAFGQEIAPLFDELEQTTQKIFFYERQTNISLRIYPTFAHHWLLPSLSDFQSKYPDYQVRLETTVERLDFRSTHLDVALQLGDGQWRDTRSRKLFDEVVDAVCSPEYAAKFDNFETPSHINQAMLIHAKYRRREWESWSSAAELTVNHLVGLEFDTSMLAYSSACHGFGIAIGQLEMLENELKSGRLVRPFHKPQKTGSAFYVVWPNTSSVSTQTRRFIDWLLINSGQKPEFFS